MNVESPLVSWDVNQIVQVKLKNDNDFYKIKETLQRMGIPSYAKKELYQTCHIFREDGYYYITHFKELFGLDGRSVTITEDDLKRRNLIIGLLEQWGLVTVIEPEKIRSKLGIQYIKILPYKQKNEWKLMAKYRIKK